MGAGYLYMFFSLVSFSLIGIFAKVADTKGCRPSAMYAFVYFWALLLVVAFALGRGSGFAAPRTVYIVAVPFGMAAAVAGIVFQIGIRYGKIATSWLVINLSAAIPTVGSIAIYHEVLNLRKAAALGLALVSMFLLWKDKQSDSPPRPVDPSGVVAGRA